jgi:hypothetical protein
LRHHPADVVEAFASGASGDLVEVVRAQDRRFFSAEFTELREEHGADRDIDADTERVRSAANPSSSVLGAIAWMIREARELA